MDLKDLGPRMRMLRQSKCLSQGDIEERTGLLRCYLSRLENGHTRPTIESLQKIVEACGTTLFEFFDDGRERPHGPILTDADREFLVEVNRVASKLTGRERRWMLEMVKQFSQQLKAGKVLPQRAEGGH